MSRFRVGQRIKKVRGPNPGPTGVVAEYDWNDDRPLGIRIDAAGIGYDEDDNPDPYAAGAVVFDYEDNWEPILDDDTRALGAELGGMRRCSWFTPRFDRQPKPRAQVDQGISFVARRSHANTHDVIDIPRRHAFDFGPCGLCVL